MIHNRKKVYGSFLFGEVKVLLSLIDICNDIRHKKELKKHPQLMISGLTLRVETKNKNTEAKKRFSRYLRKR